MVPKVAFIPIFVIWFGFGTTSKIIMAAILAFFPIMLNVMLGVRSVDRGHRDVMRGLGASRWATFKSLELPSTLPYIFAGAEVGIVFAVIGAIVGEFIAGIGGLRGGIGYVITQAAAQIKMPYLFAAALTSSLLGIAIFIIVNMIAARFLRHWHESAIRRDM